MEDALSSNGLDLSYRWRVTDPDSDDAGERIVAAALTCFTELGIRGTSMDDIARAARVGRTTVFRRFESKERLVQIVLLRIVGQATEHVQAVFHGARDLETGLTEALVVAVRELRDHPLFAKVLRIEPESFLRTITADGASVIAVVRRSIADWLGSSGGGPLSDGDAEMVAEGITRLGVSLILAPEGPIPLDDDEGLRAYFARYVVPGIARLAAS
jgi:TetR/AcrR family transcriptional regulator, repressor for uid operon